MVIDKFCPQYEYALPNRVQLQLSVKQVMSQDTLEYTLNVWHCRRNDNIAVAFQKTLTLKEKVAFLDMLF